MPAISRLFSERKLDGRTLTTAEATEFIVQATKEVRSLTIILDAVDECNEAVRNALLWKITFIQREAQCPVRILLSSRIGVDIVSSLFIGADFVSVSMQSHTDLALYIEKKVHTNMEMKVFPQASQYFTSEVIAKLQEKAGGS